MKPAAFVMSCVTAVCACVAAAFAIVVLVQEHD